jgi:hypothetical protein
MGSAYSRAWHGTILNDQYRGDWEKFLTKIETSDPPVCALGITDYYSVTSYEAVLQKKRAGRLPGVDLIFPDIEMRYGIEQAGALLSMFTCSCRLMILIMSSAFADFSEA